MQSLYFVISYGVRCPEIQAAHESRSVTYHKEVSYTAYFFV